MFPYRTFHNHHTLQTMNSKDKRPPTSISYTHTQSATCNSNDEDKRSPAYEGAKFDARGFCIYHEDVRMCRVISNGKFKIVRKICYRCGSSSLARDKKRTKKLHAQKKKLNKVLLLDPFVYQIPCWY